MALTFMLFMEVVDHQNTKIIATVGPASETYEVLENLAAEGVDVFRLNLSHGTHENHRQVIKNIRQINDKHNLHLSILADLQGPKIRIGEVENGQIELEKGEEVVFTSHECVGTKNCIYLNYLKFAEDVKEGERILIDDGKIILEVKSVKNNDEVVLKVIFGGILTSNKGVNFPDTKISLPSLTKKDLEDLNFALSQSVHWVALSFVRHAADVKDLRNRIKKSGSQAKIIAKIEKPEAVKRIDEIIRYSDGIMIARGDLGVEVPMEQLPIIQKVIINKCIESSIPVIVATQLMESMITAPSPTRAEIIDVANAVLDGVDAVMLSAESSVGDHPVRVVKAMNKIIAEAEANPDLHRVVNTKTSKKSLTFYSDIVCFNAAKVADEVKARAIIGLTTSGYTAFKVSSCRPASDIYIFSDHHHILCTLNLVWGVRGYYYDGFVSTDETINDVVDILKNKGRLKKGDIVVNTGSMPMQARLRTNMLKVTKVS